MQVIHHDDQRHAPGERLEQLANRPEGLIAGRITRIGEADRLGHPLGDQLGLLLPRQRRCSEQRRDRRGGRLAGVRAENARDVPDDPQVNARSNSPTTTASNDRSNAPAHSSSAAACGRRSHTTRREQPTSKNSTAIVPCPATSADAISRCHAREVAGSWNSAVEVRP
jgi:hypothetical protein